MRLHRLQVTAFQAFAGSEQVDFDALGEAGLFLFHGDTGAGKTTLLDAVCFALYGEVPGARARDARLRSDHAGPDVRTEVELEVTLRERRFRVVRRPKQSRPKVRGEGVTEEAHGCTVQELRDGEWMTVAARPDEARAELADPLAMTCEQFCQVVMLPQGEFAAFLRAGSDERWKLLERLFGTERFAQVEWWLRDRWRAARGELNEQLRETRDVVARLSQVAEQAPPDRWDDEVELARDWAGALSVTAEAGAVTAAEAAARARAARAASESALAAAVELSERRTRHAAAAAELERWQASRSVRDEAAAELTRARAAAPIAPLLAAAEARAGEAAEAAEVAEAAIALLAEGAPVDTPPADESSAGLGVPSTPTSTLLTSESEDVEPPTLFDLFDDAGPSAEQKPEASTVNDDVDREPATGADTVGAPLRAYAAGLRSEAGALGALVAVEERLATDEQALAALAAEAEQAGARALAAAQALAAGAQERTRLEVVLDAARRAAERAEPLAREAETASHRAQQAAERDRLAAAQTQLDDAVRVAIDAEQHAHRTWLDLRERRLAGMAAELAAGLEPGAPCAVCGATEHPSPAHVAPSPLDASAPTTALKQHQQASLADQEQAAEAAHSERAQHRASAERVAGENAARLAAARAVAGDEPAEELRAQAERLSSEAQQTAEQAAGLASAERALLALGTRTVEHDEQRRAAEQAQATARAAHQERSAALEADRARVTRGRGDAPTVAARAQALRGQADDAEAAASAREMAARTKAASEQARTAAERAAAEAGFSDTATAHAAVRDEHALDDLDRRLREFDEGIARRTALVQDEALKAAAAAPAPDVGALRAAAEHATTADESCQGRHTVEQRRLAETRRLTVALERALQALAPVAEHERVLRELSALADGSSASNRLRMRLSAYVLAARLEQVAEAATARLERMSNGRYALIHSDEGARGRRRGGLELRVVDGWTGQERAPATLSGGETFIASLALALGLADVVAAEAGGSRLETLFIDEGFGSLDERTLDEVLDVLDGLREGGRAVGIVSHVAELRQRVPARLHVVKGRHGSHVEQSTAPAAA
ncbi:MAG TPA: AAA family ATPase [Conexibacter sp.]|jgi:exonuclease SbcC